MYQTGQILFRKYRIEKLIGQGSFGEVYLVIHQDLNSRQAVKILSKNINNVESNVLSHYRERFFLEAKLGANLHHPNIVRVFDFEDQGDLLGLVMDYAPGGSLAQKIQQSINEKQLIPLSEVIKIGLDISAGLQELHRNDIVHRDLKPGNILFDKDGNAMIADLGIAQTLDGLTTRTQMGDHIQKHPGTPAYMSPEQENSVAYLKPPSDIFSFGLILFELLSGRNYKNLRTETHIRDFRPDVPEKLDNLIFTMLSSDPEKRPWDGSVVFKEFKKLTTSPEKKEINSSLLIKIGGGFIGIAVVLTLGAHFLKPGLNNLQQGSVAAPTSIVTPIFEITNENTLLQTTKKTATPSSQINLVENESFPTITTTPLLHTAQTTIKPERAWLRKSPYASEFSSVKELKKGDMVEISYRTAGDWYLVKTDDGKEGWLYIEWLDKNFQDQDIPIAQTTPTALPPEPTAKPNHSSNSSPSNSSTVYPPPYP